VTDAGLREASDRNLRESWRALAQGSENMVIEEDDDVLLIAGGVDAAFFNPAFLKVDGLAPDRVADRLRSFYGPLGVPYLLWVMHDTHPVLLGAAGRLGLTTSDGPPAMVLAPIEPQVQVPGELEIEAVRDEAGMEDAVLLASAGFGMPPELARKFLNPSMLDDPLVRTFVGRVGGEAVSTATLVVTDEVAGVYTVATPTAHRSRGYGAALTAAVVEEGRRRGCTLASLQASPMGAPVYERMGFRRVAGYDHLVGSVLPPP
jgi:GNAT superfamily N-acetyltransferase